MSEEERKAIEYFKDDINYLEEELKNPNFKGRYITIRSPELEKLKTLVNLIEKQQKEIEELKQNKIETLKELLNKKPDELTEEQTKLFNRILEIINEREMFRYEVKKKDKIINEYEKECRQFKAFCRRIRRDEKRDVDQYNQGQEYRCNQFLNLINGDKNWAYEGKYFDEYDKEMEEIKQYFERKVK